MKLLMIFSIKVHIMKSTMEFFLKQGWEVTPVSIYDVIKHLDPDNLQKEYSMFFDYIFTQHKFDAAFCYNRPDEILMAKCNQYNVRLLLEENYGHLPEKQHAIVPYGIDFFTHYGNSKQETIPLESSRVTITIPLEYKLIYHSPYNNMKSSLYTIGFTPMIAHWGEESEISSALAFVKFISDIIKEYDLTSQCDFYFRPHPKFMTEYKWTLAWLEKQKNEHVFIDNRTSNKALLKSDIVLSLRSTFGFEAQQYGAETITYKKIAHYSNPQLTHSPMNREELVVTLQKLISSLLTNGRQKKCFFDDYVSELGTKFHAICENRRPPTPEELYHNMDAIVYGCSVPLQKEW